MCIFKDVSNFGKWIFLSDVSDSLQIFAAFSIQHTVYTCTHGENLYFQMLITLYLESGNILSFSNEIKVPKISPFTKK